MAVGVDGVAVGTSGVAVGVVGVAVGGNVGTPVFVAVGGNVGTSVGTSVFVAVGATVSVGVAVGSPMMVTKPSTVFPLISAPVGPPKLAAGSPEKTTGAICDAAVGEQIVVNSMSKIGSRLGNVSSGGT